MARRATAAPTLFALAALALSLAAGCGRREAPRPALAADPEARRTTRQGEVIGAVGHYGAHVWLGLPFARPPVGELRWRAPRPPEPWNGAREALAHGAPCPQFASPLGGEDSTPPGTPTGREDCLTLDVYAPRMPAQEAAGARLPVMVWIHGGGNTIGSARFYDGGRIAQTHGVMVVTTQYRLGPFGWFRHPSLHWQRDATQEDRSGNYGTLDLIAALRWVRENAAAFGGDPGNVTIFGESAGGLNVYSLLLSPLAEGLFHRAIVQSGSLRMRPVAVAENFADDPAGGHPASSREAIARLLVQAGVAADEAAARARMAELPPQELGTWLRARSDREILAAYRAGGTGMIDMPNVFSDGFVLPDEPPMQRLRTGRYNRVPVILGTNRDENKLFMALDPEHVWMLRGVPVWMKDEARFLREASYRSRMWKAAAVDEPAAAMRAAQGPSVFAYRFDWDELPRFLWIDLGKWLGAAHAFEIPFVFGHFDLGRAGRILWTRSGAPSREALAASMMSWWAQFARTGDPARGTDGRQPRWTPWDPDGDTFLVIDTPEGGGVRMASDALTVESLVAELERDPSFTDERERCELLASLVERTPQLGRERLARVAGCSVGPVIGR